MENINSLSTVLQKATHHITNQIPKVTHIGLDEFIQMEFPKVENIIEPWFPKAGLAMVFSERGVGKTFFALEIMIAAATGGNFLFFNAPRPIKVLYIDGEMRASDMKERIQEILNKISPKEYVEPILITSDMQDEFMPDLNTSEGSESIRPLIEIADLIIVDNLSTLSSAKENEADSWADMQRFFLQIRRMGKSVLIIHHAGKSGKQRGTSKREDILDTVICLKHPQNYTPSMGICFEIHFEKARRAHGDDVLPILCKKTEKGWDFSVIGDTNLEAVIAAKNKNIAQKDIAASLGISEGYVSRLVKQAKSEGKLPVD